ncbi:N(5)-(carboxyethyl)ornithine synthase [Clostridium perfringens]|uniref:N(5)-(carboxyethyl)ornithine synthase n=1 Tax=Clostridium perfringens TaxID=1502 RepID=UPI000DA40AC4|nr:N(5)-(carboxyethyl)ornithine synthase [Clostridium perfringens]SQI03079.1 N5-(carboxyethyl)ornithine synthase [Clostridium perfringens]HBI6973918.1 N(5)-(carboxyethyl)ornithine synthase [Clostridium perfringens]
MKTIGFPISHKENENRRAVVPEHIREFKYPKNLFFEKGYGDVLGITDEEYLKLGCNVVSRDKVLNQDIICDPKIGDAEYIMEMKPGQTIFGWVHATQNRDITDRIINSGLTAYAWENMNYKGRHLFWRNNELAGEAAIMHAFQCFGRMPYETKAAVLGRGNTARGAIKVLNMLGASVTQYDRRTEQLFREEIEKYDVVVNCILWDITRQDHIIYKSDLLKMKKNAMIIDVSCDRNGGIETSIPTTIEHPTYIVDGVLHYVVDHTPTLFHKTFTFNNSELIIPYLEQLITDNCGQVLKDALVIENGIIIDKEINKFQKR